MAKSDDRDLDALVEQALASPPPRDFAAALRQPGVSLISEIKRRSPSAGDLNLSLDPAAMATQYVEGGASCLSVLTDTQFFGGSIADLRAARQSVAVPVLRKDFTVDERDVVDARIMGADAVLLIVAALTDDELTRFATQARRLSLAALFEVHDGQEVRRAEAAGAEIIGINQRDLHTFELHHGLAVELKETLPGGVISVAESGIRRPDDIAQLARAGFHAALVGSSLVTAESVRQSVADFVAAGSVS
jgi:indole-3-glycerol phosphate synthase